MKHIATYVGAALLTIGVVGSEYMPTPTEKAIADISGQQKKIEDICRTEGCDWDVKGSELGKLYAAEHELRQTLEYTVSTTKNTVFSAVGAIGGVLLIGGFLRFRGKQKNTSSAQARIESQSV